MASITFHLASFPLLNQNKEPANPYPDVNGDMDCVPTSIAAALTWFTSQQYYGDEVIDQVYGSGYTGGTAASAYEAYCAARGVKLSPVNGTPAELVTAIHTYVHEQCPVLVTVPGQWNNPATSGTNPGDVTHVMVVCGDGPGLIQVMNPWTGAFETYADSWFQIKLCYGQIWPMEKIRMVPSGWTDDGTILTAPNGVQVTTGFRTVVLDPQQWLQWPGGWNPIDWPLAAVRETASVEPGNTAIGAGYRQDFRMTSLGFAAKHSPSVYQIWVGQDITALGGMVGSLQGQLTSVNADNQKLTSQVQALLATQGAGLTPEQAAAVNQLMPLLVGIAAGASSFTTAFANVPKPNMTAPLPIPATTNAAAN